LINFTFSAPAEIYFGNGESALVGERILTRGGRRGFLVTDQGLVKAGLADRVQAVLNGHGLSTVVFAEVEENPHQETVEKGFLQAQAEGCDFVIGLGGGSPMDTAKMIATLLTNGGRVSDYEGRNKISRPPALLVAIPTTAGTASEVTPNAVITDPQRNFKMVISSPLIVPKLAILDPELTVSMPPGLTAATGMDALTHAIESYTNRTFNPIASALAERAIGLISDNLRAAVAHGKNLAARYNMLLGSLMAGLAFSYTGVGLVHAMAHPLGGHFNVPHGIANAILLPKIMEYNLIGCNEETATIARLMGEKVDGLSKWEAARRGVEAVRRLALDVGIPASLKAVGVTADKIPAMAQDALKSGNIPINPRQTNQQEIERLYRELLEG